MKIGSIHGRFQPFHNEHLDYAVMAKNKCDYLLIGITQYNVSTLDDELILQHRNMLQNNPFNYLDRVRMITDTLIEEGMSCNEFGFVPFPIESPSQIEIFVSKDIICYTTIRDEWNLKKIQLLQDQGYTVEVLKRDTGQKKISGSIIRKHIFNNSDEWKHMVPNAIYHRIKKWNHNDAFLLKK
ncbi:MAG: nicotinate-nucleotide adenylyltransferase [Gammaproteobacteria bacterium]|nr:nicotinate-nucleotide adenylyltransferase [Gammaproteobacteria bacterium]